MQTFAKCQTKDQRHNRGSNNNNRGRHGKSNSNNNRMFGGAINEIPAFDRAEAQSGSQRGSQTKCKESKSYMYVHAIHICIQMPCRHTYIRIHMLRQLTKPLITDCRYSTLAALNEICRQSRRRASIEEAGESGRRSRETGASAGRTILKWKWQWKTPNDALWR